MQSIEELRELLDRANAENKVGKCDEAEVLCNNALDALSRIVAETDEAERELLVLHARALRIMSASFGKRDRAKEALKTGEEALAMAIKAMDKEEEANAVASLGIAYLYLSDLQRALEYMGRAVDFYEQMGNRSVAAVVRGNLGNVYCNLLDYPKALESFHAALSVHEELEMKPDIARVNSNIGTVYSMIGEPQRALEYFERGLQLNRELGLASDAAKVIGNIGFVYYTINENEQALKYFSEALAIQEEVGNQARVAMALGSLAEIYRRLGDFTRAIELMNQSLVLQQELGLKMEAVSVMGSIGLLYADTNFDGHDPIKAEEFLKKSIGMMEELGTRLLLHAQYKSLAEIYKQMNRWKDAYEYLEKSVLLEKEVQGEELKKQAERFAIERDVALIKREQEVLSVKNSELSEMNERLEQALEELKIIQEDLIMSERATAATNQLLSEKNEILYHLNQEKNEFLGIAAHDLKNPLAAIVTSAQLLNRYAERLSPEKMQEKLLSIEHSASYMQGIIVNLLDVNAIESGISHLKKMTINVAEKVRGIADSYRERAELKEISIELQSKREICGIADDDALTQVLENLISNAVKYSPHGKKVFVQCLHTA